MCQRLCVASAARDSSSTVCYRISVASTLPKREYKPRPLKQSPSELNGVPTASTAKSTGEMPVPWALHSGSGGGGCLLTVKRLLTECAPLFCGIP